MTFDRYDLKPSFNDDVYDSLEERIAEKDRIIDVQERDMESLKREIVSLKKQLNYSKRKKK